MENLQAKLREYLEDGEELIWVGKPKQGILLKASDVFTIPFSLFWLGFAVFWVIGASKSGGLLFGLFGVPFVLAGLMFVFGRFIVDARKRRNTVYGLTKKRVIVQSGIMSMSIKSLNIGLQGEINLSERKDGYGTISFGDNEFARNISGSMSWWPGIELSPSIELIKDARKVYGYIISIQNEEK